MANDAHAQTAALPLEEAAEELYDGAPCGYLSTLPDGLIVRVNETLLSWTGYSRDELVGRRRFAELLSPGGRIYHETHYAPLLRMQRAVREIAVEMVRADGSRIPVLVNSVMLLDEAGRPRVVRTTVFDATERKEYERELLRARQRAEQADKIKADFIAMISHEIRTPLSSITGIAHLLSLTELSPPQQKYVRILRSSSESLLALVNDILDFSKIESGTMQLEERPVDLREVVQGIADSLRVKASEKGIALETQVDPAIPAAVLGDPIKIRQVLTNLAGNAVKFTTEGAVTLSLQAEAVEPEMVSVRFAVADTGIGIAPDRLPRIFDDYAQASYDIGLQYGGTGLGLGISRKLVELYGSRIHVESEVGKGSTFSFTLRLKRPAPGPEQKRVEGPLTGLQALLVDDNEVNIFVTSDLLRRWGASFEVVRSGREAVECVKQRRYDVVLMDIHMPDGDGRTATREIRALPDRERAAVPIIAVSGSTRAAEERSLDDAGFTGFVGKPVNPDLLLRRLREYLPAAAR
jgi:PAS domain S-box-containing protein